MSVNRVLYKYRSACKTEYLSIGKELHNILMAISEMATVTLVKNHNNAFIFDRKQFIAVIVLRYGSVKFLNCSNNDFAISIEAFDKFRSVVGIIYSTRFKCFVF